MEANDFEKSIKERFVDHGAATPESVWNAITGDLDRKRRIVAFWWWNALSALCILILATSFYWNMDQTPIGNNTEVPFSSATAVPSNEPTEDDENVKPNASKELVQAPTNKLAFDQYQPSNSAQKKQKPSGINKKNSNDSLLDGSKQQFIEERGDEIIPAKKPNKLTDAADSIDEHLSLEPLIQGRLPMTSAALMEVATYRKTTPNYNHSFGLELSTFANLSKPRAVEDSPPTSLAESSENQTIRYQKFLEIAPYYQFSFNGWKSHLKVVSLVSFANSNGSLQGKHTSYGAGLGYLHHFSLSRRTLLGVYGTSRWEMNFGQFTTDPSTTIVDSTSMPIGVDPEPIISTYRQHLFSLEAGIEMHYMLTLRTHVFTSLGYRNYFWQQKVPSSHLIQIPQMMKFSIGISHTL